MKHDRYLEEPPEHPDDCGCRECREETTAMLVSEDDPQAYAEPLSCNCATCYAWAVGAYDGPPRPCLRPPREGYADELPEADFYGD